MEGLTKSDDDTTAHAESARATAFLAYEDVSDALGLEASESDRPGRIDADLALPLGGSVCRR